MEAGLSRSGFPAASIRGQTLDNDYDDIVSPSSLRTAYEFDEAQCLFCNQTSSDLDENISHMSKTHGLYIDQTNLVVDPVSLLTYFHLVISGCFECLYCGTQRNTRQAVQQHMMGKGHCKYDITDKDAELRDFYDFSSSDDSEERRSSLSSRHFLGDPQLPLKARSRKPRPPRRPDTKGPNGTASPLEQSISTPSPGAYIEDDSNPIGEETRPQLPGELSTRAQKQGHTLNNQLARLRAADRRSLSHLPASQQRAVLVTHHKQMEKANRTEQINRGNLESAGNKVNCLDKIRLMRKPPHTGNVHSLNR